MRNNALHFRRGLTCAVGALVLAEMAHADVINIGSPAPALKTYRWIKGTPIQSFQKGRIYVVEFWATWCGPCKTSIPHLTDLAHKYRGKVTFIGVSIWENLPDHDPRPGAAYVPNVEAFVKHAGDTMNYKVAVDGPEGLMAKSWMAAANEGGIPTAFVIDKGGKVAWIGHPQSNLDDVLNNLIADKFDAKAFATQRKTYEAQMIEVYTALPVIEQRVADGKMPEAMRQLDDLITRYPSYRSDLLNAEFAMLAQAHPEEALKLAKSQGENELKNDPIMLNMFAWAIVNLRGKFKNPDVEIALALASRAVELTKEKDPAFLDTLAYIYFKKGDRDRAIKIETKAMELLDHSANEENAEIQKELEARLEMFHKRAKGRLVH